MGSLIVGGSVYGIYLIKKHHDEKNNKSSPAPQNSLYQQPPQYQDSSDYLPEYERYASTPAQPQHNTVPNETDEGAHQPPSRSRTQKVKGNGAISQLIRTNHKILRIEEIPSSRK